MKKLIILGFLASVAFSFNSCRKLGCANPLADNYNSGIKEKNNDNNCSYTSQLNIYLNDNLQQNWKDENVEIVKIYVAGSQIFNDSIHLLPTFDNQLCESVSVSYIQENTKATLYSVAIRAEGFDFDQKLLKTSLGGKQITAGTCENYIIEL